MTTTDRVDAPSGPATDPDAALREDPFRGRIVDFRRTARRLARSALLLSVAAVVGWLVTGVAGSGVALSDLPAWLGAVLAGMFVVEVVVVGGSAVRGLLRAGEDGERLAGGDVGLLPPQVRRRVRR